MVTRIIVGVILAIAFAVVWYFGGVLFLAVCCAVSLLCAYEMLDEMKKAGRNICPIPIYIAAALVAPIVHYHNIYWYIAALLLCIFASIVIRIFSDKSDNDDMLCSLLIYIYPLTTLAILFNVCYISRLAMLLTFAGPLIGDTLAYFFGVTMGRRKLCENVSPKKTIAGSIGGIIGGGLGGLLTYFIQFSNLPINITPKIYGVVELIIIGLVLGITGQVGDLFASCIKRWAGVKDYGSIFPGHGGMMDRIDSVMMSAPFVLVAFSLILG